MAEDISDVIAMADVFTREKRSFVMSRIRSRGNRETELELIRLFRTNNITGWRRNWPLEGKPDFVFPKLKLVIFVDGCFWHGCQAHSKTPKSNRDYWEAKLLRNRLRDRKVTRRLRKSGWNVLRLWHHDFIGSKRDRVLRRILAALRESSM